MITMRNDTNEERSSAESEKNVHDIKIPVLQEELHVDTQQVKTGTVKIHKTISERVEIADVPLSSERVSVQRIPIGQQIEADSKPQVRYEGDVLIVPIFEEILVVEKRLVLKEELHITRTQQEFHTPQSVVLRSEEVSVERFDSADTAGVIQ